MDGWRGADRALGFAPQRRIAMRSRFTIIAFVVAVAAYFAVDLTAAWLDLWWIRLVFPILLIGYAAYRLVTKNDTPDATPASRPHWVFRTVGYGVAIVALTAIAFRGTEFHFAPRQSRLPSDQSAIQTITARDPNFVLSSDQSANETFAARVTTLQTAQPATRTPALGSCAGALFSLADDAPKAKQVFHDGDVLRIPIRYSAPGCRRASGNIFGYFEPNSPWHEYYCKDCGQFNAAIPVEFVMLGGDGGIAQLSALPGPFPPPDLASPPNLEGFVFCGVILSFDNGTSGDFDPREQLGAGCGGPSFAR